MNRRVTKTIATLLAIQMLTIPFMSVGIIAAPPFDDLGSPMATPPPAGTGSTEATRSYQTDNYFTDAAGNILMNVNVWGHVAHPGQVTVPEETDISTLISLAGGPSADANLKKIRLNRAHPDDNGNMTYMINLEQYAKKGDRSMLIALQPNDTIIVPENKALDTATILGIIGAALSIYAITNN